MKMCTVPMIDVLVRLYNKQDLTTFAPKTALNSYWNEMMKHICFIFDYYLELGKNGDKIGNRPKHVVLIDCANNAQLGNTLSYIKKTFFDIMENTSQIELYYGKSNTLESKTQENENNDKSTRQRNGNNPKNGNKNTKSGKKSSPNARTPKKTTVKTPGKQTPSKKKGGNNNKSQKSGKNSDKKSAASDNDEKGDFASSGSKYSASNVLVCLHFVCLQMFATV